MLGTFTYKHERAMEFTKFRKLYEADIASEWSFNVINTDVDEGGYTYYLLNNGKVAYEYEGTFEPLISPQDPLPEEDGWGIVDTLTDEDK